MAKSRYITRAVPVPVRSGPTTIRIAAPAAIRGAARAGGRHVRRGARAVVRGAVSEKHTLVAVGAAGVFGLLEKAGITQQIPTIGPLGPVAVTGLGAWLYGRVAKSQMGQHIATGLLCVAINRLASQGVVAGDPRAVVFDDDD